MLAGFLANSTAGYRGPIFGAQAIITAPVIYSTAAGTGGPLLWNGSQVGGGRGVDAHILAVSYGLTTASTVSGAIGFTGGTGQSSAPTATTAISGSSCLAPLGGMTAACNVYSVGTLSAAGTFLIPLGHVHTGAITVDTDDDNWVHLGGSVIVQPQGWFSLAASATLTTAVMTLGLIWMEVARD